MRSESVRQAALERDGHRCQICGEEGPLEVHHVEALGMGGVYSRDVAENAITLCVDCHRKVEAHQLHIERWDGDELEVTDSESHVIPHERLWHYRQALARELEPIEARIVGLHKIDGSVAEDLWRLWKDDAFKALDPEADSFAQYAASRGWDSRRASEYARLYDQTTELPWRPDETATDYKRRLKAAGVTAHREFWQLGIRDEATLERLIRQGDLTLYRATDHAFALNGGLGLKVGKWYHVKVSQGEPTTRGGYRLPYTALTAEPAQVGAAT